MKPVRLVFWGALCLLLVVLVTGTVYALLHDTRARKLASTALPEPAPGHLLYEGIGKIRARLADGETLVLVRVVFPVAASDAAWLDELSDKRGALKTATQTFFLDLDPALAATEYELIIKAALRDTLNGLLVLGKIDELYFPEFLILR